MQDLACRVKQGLEFYAEGSRGILTGFKQESDLRRRVMPLELSLERSQGLCRDHE